MARRSRGSLVARTNRSFAAMLAWALATAAVSLVAFNSLVTTLRNEAVDAERKSALLSVLQPTMNEAIGAGYDLVDTGAEALEYYADIRDELDGVLSQAEDVLTESVEHRALAGLAAGVEETFAPIDGLAAAGRAADEPDTDALRDGLGIAGESLWTSLYDLDEAVRSTTSNRLEAGQTFQENLTVVLAALFALSFATTIYFARRNRRDVLVPLGALGETVDRFAAGDLSHRASVDRPQEFAELARVFNAMAEVLDADQQRLAQQALVDELTGLANRRAFTERLDAAFAGAVGSDEGVGIVFIDLDDFKTVNDAGGHAAGDEMLRDVAHRLQDHTRASELVARLGGDEFAVLLERGSTVGDARSLARRIVAELAEPVTIDGREYSAGASVGVAFQDATVVSTEDLLQRADTAMYLSKGRGKGRFEVYDAVLHDVLGAAAARIE
ncbi:MAG TPA: diguanylate cyclase [Acidimicrobiales bacterium]|nr:diguanylate cyclase [Acidimicrobiales bacterium]